MKFYLLIVLAFIFILGCDSSTEPSNSAPAIPSQPSPANNAPGQSVDVDLSWSGSDPDGDILIYDVYFGTSEDPPLVSEDQPERNYQPDEMQFEQTYYWKIVAKDEHDHSTTGQIWRFTTAANQPPEAPSNPSPVNNAINQQIDVDLSWSCSDPDVDPLTFDIYFGTTEDPPKVSEEHADTLFDPGELNHRQTYYWMVDAKDDHNHTTVGQVWTFTTVNTPPEVPSNPFPADNATDQPIDVNLSWSCSDPDGDPLAYDVYFGTTDNPPLVAENLVDMTYDPAELDSIQTYYWKIGAEDDNGNSIEGSVWSFSTCEYEHGEERDFVLTDSVNITMVWIPAGSFMMGSPEDEIDRSDNEGPVHEVTIDYGFWMGKYEVTQAQWEAVTGENPSHNNGENRPVEMVLWWEIQNFLGQVITGFRLPSEAEWEYSCRAGTQTRFFWGDDPNYIDDYAWHRDNSFQSHEVGQKLANNWGLHDMIGNVCEWCEDDYHDNYYGAHDDSFPWIDNPRADKRVLRGESYVGHYSGRYCSANRFSSSINSTTSDLGFRLVLDR